MKREMVELCYRVTGTEMEKVLNLAKSLYPRHKYKAYMVRSLYNGESPRYGLWYNLTDAEYHYLCDEYIKNYGNPLIVESEV